MKDRLLALVLAAGEGTRFRSEKTKVLHPLLGKPMLRLVLDSVFHLKPEKVLIVVGYQKEAVIKETSSFDIGYIDQKLNDGIAHAVLSAKSILRTFKDRDLLVLGGNLPLIRAQALSSLLNFHRRQQNSVTWVGSGSDNPDAAVIKIKDLLPALSKTADEGARKPAHFVSVIQRLARTGKKVEIFDWCRPEDFLCVRTRQDLAEAVGILRKRKMDELAGRGVTIYNPASTWVDLDVVVGRDTTLYPGVTIEGRTRIGINCFIYPGVHISNSQIGDRVRVFSSSVMDGAIIEDDAQVGPFSRLRPKTVLRAGARVGNFVEVKNTDFGKGSKALHLSYLGDSEIHEGVNIGAGTITCNYDGLKKNKTTIEAGAFIGSGTELVAPVKIGRGAYIGAGSVITKDVSPEALAVARSRQVERPGWARRKKVKK